MGHGPFGCFGCSGGGNSSEPPGVAFWTYPDGPTVSLCQDCLDHSLDAADDGEEPVKVEWFGGARVLVGAA
jgi:hypothetical protein